MLDCVSKLINLRALGSHWKILSDEIQWSDSPFVGIILAAGWRVNGVCSGRAWIRHSETGLQNMAVQGQWSLESEVDKLGRTLGGRIDIIWWLNCV